MSRKKMTLLDVQKKRQAGEPIVMITSYDYPSTVLAEKAGVDLILVGDSLGMVVHGLDGTVGVTMEMMILHCKAVMRANPMALIIGDMPFGSYEVSVEEGVRNAFRLMKEGGVDVVKLEGGADRAGVIRAITGAGIGVMGHIGLTPQSASKLGGFKVQGKTAQSARQLLADALALQAAGCFALVLEAVPERVAAAITQRLTIPTIGIGAGAGCSGQVLVWHDLLGLYDRLSPKFSKRFAEAGQLIEQGLTDYVQAVRGGTFPTADHTFPMKDEEWVAFESNLVGSGEEDGENVALYGQS